MDTTTTTEAELFNTMGAADIALLDSISARIYEVGCDIQRDRVYGRDQAAARRVARNEAHLASLKASQSKAFRRLVGLNSEIKATAAIGRVARTVAALSFSVTTATQINLF